MRAIITLLPRNCTTSTPAHAHDTSLCVATWPSPLVELLMVVLPEISLHTTWLRHARTRVQVLQVRLSMRVCGVSSHTMFVRVCTFDQGAVCTHAALPWAAPGTAHVHAHARASVCSCKGGGSATVLGCLCVCEGMGAASATSPGVCTRGHAERWASVFTRRRIPPHACRRASVCSCKGGDTATASGCLCVCESVGAAIAVSPDVYVRSHARRLTPPFTRRRAPSHACSSERVRDGAPFCRRGSGCVG